MSVLLNAFPYGSGHLLVLPNRAVADLAGLDRRRGAPSCGPPSTTPSPPSGPPTSPTASTSALNLGSAAGAGVPDHLHVHVLPRWGADANFMTAVAETRVLPEPLVETCRKVTGAWPGS